MSITPGAHLGRYEIRSLLGAGGMGEVYRARDPKLNRDVAIKVLPAAFSADPERLRRFEQEAQAAGSLNHPNILAIYDVATHEGAPYVVSELLEGQTLRQRLNGSALPERKALDYALQITRGLAAAHEKGIVHRDLKPENLFFTNDGRVKILDFGLAKLIEPRGGIKAPAELPTRPLNTDPGTVMGTVGYMSPEQVRGQPVDHRSDIFSLGVILYEMLAGERPFRGESAVETLNAILKEDPPDLSTTNDPIATLLERVVRHCLQKRPHERFQSALDLAFALESPSAPSAPSLMSPALAAPGIHSEKAAVVTRLEVRERLVWIASLALVFLAGLALGITYLRRTPTDTVPIRFLVSLPEKVAFDWEFSLHNLSISPNGRRLAFIATSEGKRRLWVRPLEALSAQVLPGTEGAFSPFWSPDSRFIGFFAEGKLKKIEASGGPPQTLCNLTELATGGTWGREGTILFNGRGAGAGIYRVSATGGQAMLVIKIDPAEDVWLHFLPDGRHFLYSALREQREDYGIYVGSLDSHESRLLVQAKSRVEYAPPGYLLYASEGTLLAQPFNATKLQVTGEPFPVIERLLHFEVSGWAEFSVSENGVLAYKADTSISRLAWFDRRGREVGQVGAPDVYQDLRLSPDGQRVAMNLLDARTLSGDLWIHELARDTRRRFTSDPADEGGPVWSPDARRMAFFSYRGADKPTLYVKELNDTGSGESPLQPGFQKPDDWSLDGQFVAYTQVDPKTGEDLWVLPMVGDRKPIPYLRTQFSETGFRFSPDSRWVAFVSEESGRPEVYVMSFDGSREKWPISTDGGTQPRWRRDGKELFFLTADNKLMAVPVKPRTEAFETGVPVVLFRIDSPGWDPYGNAYDITADGQRFLIQTGVAGAQSLPFAVVVNWTAGLKR